MIEHFAQFLEQIPGVIAFAGVIAVLFICGLGLPLPEEIPLVLAGYLVYVGHVNLEVCFVATFVAILAGDSALFLIGQKLGNRIFDIPMFSKLLTPKRMTKVNQYFQRYGNRVVFIARFMAGVRSTVFLTAGILQMPFRRFLLLDGIAALISAPLIVWLAYRLFRLGDEIGDGLSYIRQIGWMLFFVVFVLVVGVTILVVRLRAHRKRKLIEARKAKRKNQTLIERE